MRREGWPEILYRTVEEARESRFEYGVADCVLFVATVVDAITARPATRDNAWVDEMKLLYSDERSAIRRLAEEGGLEAAVTRRLGEPLPWPLAMRGDVCGIPTEQGLALGICMGATIAGLAPEGITLYPLDAASMIWRVQ